MRLHILHLVHQYPPERVGGTELYTQSLARQQVRQGHIVSVFCPSSAVPAEPDAVSLTIEDGVRVYRASVGKRSRLAVFGATFGHAVLQRAFQSVVDREEIDVVHIQHLMGLPVRLVDSLIAQRLPYVVTLHDYGFLCANAQLLTNYSGQVCDGPRLWVNCGRCAMARAGHMNLQWLAPGVAPLMAYRSWLLKRVLDQAQAIIAPTRFVQDVYRRAGWRVDKMRVIPHGIEVSLDVTCRPRAQPVPGRLHIAYIGGLSWQKGVHVLIDAVNQLPADRVRLSIYGNTEVDPDYVSRLRNTAQHPGIFFAGGLPHPEVWSALGDVDVVVVPSLWYETSSLIAQEASAAGVPVIASNIGALADRVRDGVDGLLFPPGDSGALRAVLLRLVDNRDLLLQLRDGIQPVRTIGEHVNDIGAIYALVVKSFR